MFDERLYQYMRYIRIRGKRVSHERAIEGPDCNSKFIGRRITRASWRNLFSKIFAGTVFKQVIT